MKKPRNGRTLTATPSNCTSAVMATLGFTEEQARRMIATRRVLPIVEHRQAPCIDGRKLWERLGKPHSRFNEWAANYIKPLINHLDLFTEISVKVAQGEKGRPRVDYTLSRNVAAHLAMMANTPEAADIRCYFLDMEELAERLLKYLPTRVAGIISTDNELTHHCIKKASEAANAGDIRKDQVPVVANGWERAIKSLTCEVTTGYRAGTWRDMLDGNRGVRDVLSAEDLLIYSRCYDVVATLFKAGVTDRAQLKAYLLPSFGNKINPAKYGVGLTEAA